MKSRERYWDEDQGMGQSRDRASVGYPSQANGPDCVDRVLRGPLFATVSNRLRRCASLPDQGSSQVRVRGITTRDRLGVNVEYYPPQ